jgi:aspartyl-tRNA(Asn)/glutamyl-tRNA(Gln) amidotransferase subunit C
MSLTQDQIKKIISNLSKVSLKNEEKALKNMNNILKYMDLLQEVDTKNIKATISVINKKNILREDIIIKNDNQKELLNCSQQNIINNSIAIPNIMK